MSDNMPEIEAPKILRKRGRPKKVVAGAEVPRVGAVAEPVPAAPATKPDKPRPECEKRPQGYPYSRVVWGTEAQYAKYKRLGIAVLYDKTRGDHIILMPVTDDDGELRWRYRWVPGPAPYHYEFLTIEPAAARELAQTLLRSVDEIFGGQAGATQVEVKVVQEIKKEQSESRVDEMLKKFKGVL